MTNQLAYTRLQAAALCGVSPDTISRAKNTGALRAKQTSEGGKDLYTHAALMAWLEGLGDA